MSIEDTYLRFLEAIIRGGTATSGKGIVGQTDHETTQMRAEWFETNLPGYSIIKGINIWDGMERLPRRKEEKK